MDTTLRDSILCSIQELYAIQQERVLEEERRAREEEEARARRAEEERTARAEAEAARLRAEVEARREKLRRAEEARVEGQLRVREECERESEERRASLLKAHAAVMQRIAEARRRARRTAALCVTACAAFAGLCVYGGAEAVRDMERESQVAISTIERQARMDEAAARAARERVHTLEMALAAARTAAEPTVAAPVTNRRGYASPRRASRSVLAQQIRPRAAEPLLSAVNIDVEGGPDPLASDEGLRSAPRSGVR